MAPKISRRPHIRQFTLFPRRLHRKLTQRSLLPVTFGTLCCCKGAKLSPHM
ncbi:uncharacterized protein K441DRAFT_666692, partial [Cenococcum geophilum 1.58]|uniref:uncharacterized protein n=1 Tax=Cenococcum geophilum 1.58 TaxID=794803 RepID=UPI00358EC253